MHQTLMSMIHTRSNNEFLSFVPSAEVTLPSSIGAREAQSPMNDAKGA